MRRTVCPDEATFKVLFLCSFCSPSTTAAAAAAIEGFVCWVGAYGIETQLFHTWGIQGDKS